MMWTYRITASSRPRLAMRVAQIFDQQMLEAEQFHLTRQGDATSIHIVVECDAFLAHRIHAKLYRLTDIVHADLLDEALQNVAGEEPQGSSPYRDPLAPQP